MNVILQTNYSEDIRINKTINDIISLEGVLKEETSIITPTIIIDGNVSSLAVCNYMTISAFGRRYYITDIRSIRNGLVEIDGKVDVLTSFGAQIRNCTGIIHKQENIWNMYLDDGTFKVYSNPMIVQKVFSGGFSSEHLVLAVAGTP